MKKDKIYSMYKACSEEITSRTNEIQHLLLGEGNFDADVMIIAEVPSAKEEEYNQNILEDHRHLLLQVLEPLDLTLEDVYFTHLMKYRPYRVNKNGRIVSRAPQKEELEFFIPYLEKEISLIAPKLIITLGNSPFGWLAKDSELRINVKEDQLLVVGILGKSYKLYPIYHPAAKVFNDSVVKFKKEDIPRIRTILYNEHNGDMGQKPLTKHEEPKEEELPPDDQKKLKERVFTKLKIKPVKASERNYVTVIYAGEGYVDDPVIVGLERISHVLTELGVGIHRIDLYKGNISMKKAFEYILASSGVILAVNIEWYGIGRRMQGFLDECFQQGDVEYFQNKPLLGVVFARHAYEGEAYRYLVRSWEVLGGYEGVSLLAAIKSAAELETNFDWLFGIEKKTEQFFRMLKQDRAILPRSSKATVVAIETPVAIEHISSISENEEKDSKSQLVKKQTGIIEDYDVFVEKQQQDIKEISSLFKKKLTDKSSENRDLTIPGILKAAYKNKEEIASNIQLIVEDRMKENTVIELNNQHIRCYFGQLADVDVTVTGSRDTFLKIVTGKLSMQRAFMTGEVKAKGDFTILYKFEKLFVFR